MSEKPDKDAAAIEAMKARYHAAGHAMQSAVTFFMETPHLMRNAATEPKQLRVGVNAAMVHETAIAQLLLAKGIITELELHTALAEQMEAEVERYRRLLPPELRERVSFA